MEMTLEWILVTATAMLGGVNVFQLVYYRTQRDKMRAEADGMAVDAQHKGLDLMQDQADYLIKQLNTMQEEYISMQKMVREQFAEHTSAITEKCNEIAALKSKVVYLKGLRCYKSDCSMRITNNENELNK